MALNYNIDHSSDSFALISDEYTGWFLGILKRAFYPEQADAAPAKPPQSFEEWLRKASTNSLDVAVTRQLEKTHKDLLTQAGKLTKGGAPDYKGFEVFTTSFQDFMGQIKRMERDIILDDAGWDSLTGLRSMTALKRDFNLEMERLSRHGKPFCLALLRINNLSRFKKQQDNELERLVQKVADMIKSSVRSFDDAYHMPDHTFLLLFKQADIGGGVRAMERLREHLEKFKIVYEVDGHKVSLMLSSCIAELTPGDKLDELICYLQESLSDTDAHSSTVLEYTELSPLERFIQEKMKT